MPYAAFQASHIYGATVASMQVLDASSSAAITARREVRPAVVVTGTGSSVLLRPYRGYAAAISAGGDCSQQVTPHKSLRFSLTVNVGAVPSAADIAQAVWNSQAALFNYAGTLGAKLNTASSGGIDTGALADAIHTDSRALTVPKFIALKDA